MAPLIAVFLCTLAATAQVCRFEVAGLNRNRRVIGNVNVECPFTLHTVPFGNWGVTSNFGGKVNGSQFQGWCHDTPVCDNTGSCRTQCADGWYEWNSCTDDARFRAPNCTLYNAASCTQQATITGVNIHGNRIIDLPVSCPTQSGGGCSDLRTFSAGTNFMSLYELDPAGTDELVQTIYFPETVLALDCNAWNCKPASSSWVAPVFYDSPASPARVYAEMAMVVNAGTFVDTSRSCRAVTPALEAVSAASYHAPVAPDSIASAFGDGLAPGSSGVSVSVVDSAGTARTAPLFYVSPSQVNFLVPAATLPGSATVRVTRSDGITAAGQVAVARIAPGLFFRADGIAAAIATRVAPDGSRATLPADEAIDVALGDVYLSLYATGIRGNGGIGNISVTVGGLPAQVFYAGPQPEYPGLDQVNILLPAALAGRGNAEIELRVGQAAANPVQIRIR